MACYYTTGSPQPGRRPACRDFAFPLPESRNDADLAAAAGRRLSRRSPRRHGLGRRLAHIGAEMAMLEERWLEVSTQLESIAATP